MRDAVMIIAMAVLFCLGVYVGYLLFYTPPHKTITVTQQKTHYLKKPKTTQELQTWYTSPIMITAHERNNIIRVRAQDECKMAEADIRIDSPTPTRPFILGVTVGVIATILTILII